MQPCARLIVYTKAGAKTYTRAGGICLGTKRDRKVCERSHENCELQGHTVFRWSGS